MRKTLAVFLVLSAFLGSASFAQAALVGIWEMNGNLNNSVGGGPAAVLGPQFDGTNGTASFVSTTIDGNPAQVLAFPSGAFSGSLGLTLPNLSGSNLGEFTLIMDVKLDSLTDYNGWNALAAFPGTTGFWAKSLNNIDYNNAKPASSNGSFLAGQWYRIGVTKELSTNTIKIYIDGVVVGTDDTAYMTGGIGYIGVSGLHLLADATYGDPGQTSSGQLNSVALWANPLTDSEMAALGAPGAAGIGFQQVPASSSRSLVVAFVALLAGLTLLGIRSPRMI